VRDREYCDGSYHVQIGRHDRCPLSESGTLYWQYVPEFFDWNPRSDLTPCPLNRNYQLVRTVLTVAAVPEGSIPGHAVLLHDARNPAFQPEGEGYMAFCETSDSLLNKDLLLRCTWQNLLNHLRRGGLMPWLSEALERKYGL
jgi:hypothetical protein